MEKYIFYNRGQLRSISASYRFPRLHQACALELRNHRFADAQKRRVDDGIPRNKNQIDAALYGRNQRRYSLPHTPFHAISYHGVADFLADRKTNLRACSAIFCIHQRKELPSAGFTDTVGITKLFLPPKGITVFHATASLHPSSVWQASMPSCPARIAESVVILRQLDANLNFSKYKHAASKCPPQALVRFLRF